MKTYTLGEILRLGLLKNHKGEAYKNKVTISRLVAGKAKKVQTPWGSGFAVSQATIDRLNARWG